MDFSFFRIATFVFGLSASRVILVLPDEIYAKKKIWNRQVIRWHNIGKAVRSVSESGEVLKLLQTSALTSNQSSSLEFTAALRREPEVGGVGGESDGGVSSSS